MSAPTKAASRDNELSGKKGARTETGTIRGIEELLSLSATGRRAPTTSHARCVDSIRVQKAHARIVYSPKYVLLLGALGREFGKLCDNLLAAVALRAWTCDLQTARTKEGVVQCADAEAKKPRAASMSQH